MTTHPLDDLQHAATQVASLLDAAQHLAHEVRMEGPDEAANGLYAVLTAAQDAARKVASDLDCIKLPRT